MEPVSRSLSGKSAGTPASHFHSPLQFFLVVFVLSLPFWVVGAATGIQLLPGLPLAALTFVCPAIAAVIFVYHEDGKAAVAALLKRSIGINGVKVKIWYAPSLLLAPAISILSFGLMRGMSVPLPVPQISPIATMVLFLIFFVGASAEELGWSGYAIDLLQANSGALKAALLLGAVWAAWHIVPLMQAHRPTTWITWWCVGTVATRVLMVWVYNNAGKSVFAVALFHAMLNVAWQSFPIHGSFFDPRINALITSLLATAVTIVWGPRTLTKSRRRAETGNCAK